MNAIPDAIFQKTLADGRIVAVVPMIYTFRITVGRDEYGWDWAWCYDSPVVAIAAAADWNGEGEPIGWRKEVHTGRRQVDGRVWSREEYESGAHLQ